MENNANLFKAYILAQTGLKNPTKNKTAGSEKFSYMYTSLDKLIEETKPTLLKNGLSIIQQVVGDGIKVGVKTILIHVSGESMSETLWVPQVEIRGGNAVQGLGASITYARRYAWASLLGLASEDDNDANLDVVSFDKGTEPHPNRFNPPIKGNGTFPGLKQGIPEKIKTGAAPVIPVTPVAPLTLSNTPVESPVAFITPPAPPVPPAAPSTKPPKAQFNTPSFSQMINKKV